MNGVQGGLAGQEPKTIRLGVGRKRGITGLFEDFRDVAAGDEGVVAWMGRGFPRIVGRCLARRQVI
jgi:hypothetical protein